MSILGDPFDPERFDGGESLEPAVEHETARPDLARIGQGSFACPSCDLPLLPERAIPIATPLECPFCGGVHPARQYVHLDDFDTARNRVVLRARLP